jgi:hypothetical protein
VSDIWTKIEDGAIPPHDPGEYCNPLVVLMPYDVPAPIAVA